ncbi:MAG: hypothetical protein JKY95_04575 [Planctomycetaceae bacterium]|nr:hypothetical protein [Planctomycetaceae bacterium]
MKRYYFDQGHRQFSQQTFSEYNPEAIKQMLSELDWQEQEELAIDFQEHISEEELGLPKNLTTTDAFYYPEHHEPKYAYPLIIWLTDERTSFDLQEMMPRISDRNYLGLDISLNQFLSDNNRHQDVSGICPEQLLSHIQEELSEFNQQAKIHPDRIYLAGVGACASLAMKLTLVHPLPFAGFLAINPVNQGLDNPLANFRFLKHLKGLLTTTGAASDERENDWVKPFSQLLHNAGVQLHLDTQRKSEGKACRLIDRVVMQSIGDSYSNK